MLRLTIPLFLPRFRSHKRVAVFDEHNAPIVHMVTSWNKRCGVFAYSRYLAAELKKITTLSIIDIPEDHVLSPYFFVLGFKTGRSNSLVHVQFAYGEFDDLKIRGLKRLSTFSGAMFYAGLAAGNVHVVTTFHELMKKERASARVGATYSKFLNKLICNVSDVIIVQTNENKRIMETVYGVEPSKLKLIPMGTPEISRLMDKTECKRQLGVLGKTVVVFPGFVSRHKGIDLAVKILPALGKNVHYLISGGYRTAEDEVYLEEVKQLATGLGCIDQISFNSDFPIPPTILNAADLALLPYTSASESMALRLLVAYRIPTITSDLAIFKEINQNYSCIELFTANSTANLLEKTRLLVLDEKRQLKLKENCQRMWSETKWSVIAAKHIETYLEVFSAHPDSLYMSPRQKERLEWLRTNRSGCALEIGCATGYVADYAGAHVGLDLNIYRLRLAKKRYHDKDFVLANAMYLPFTDKAFETVLIPEILEHLPPDLAGKIVIEARRAGAKLLVTLPNADKVGYDKELVEAPEHVWLPKKELVERMIKGSKIGYSREEDFMLVTA
jgi:glycosyltransferase involved in cell wall biosynthesis